MAVAAQMAHLLVSKACKVGARAILGCLALSGVAGVSKAYADNPDSLAWAQNIGRDAGSTTKPSIDRSFVREWEANPPKGFPTLSPANVGYMDAAIKRYSDIVAKGGWPAVPEVQLEAGQTNAAVHLIRAHLTLSGDLREETSYPDYFDGALQKSVMRFQASNGLTPTGVVDKRTVAALNVPADVRLKQLKLNIGRVRELSHQTGRTKYVVVNIPGAQIEAVEGDKVISRHSGVVGKVDRPSPTLHSAIHELNFNPVWTLPPTVIEKDLVPKGVDMQRKGQDVLAKFGIDAYDGNGRKMDTTKINWSSSAAKNIQFKQQPGKENPLGHVKINFYNNYSVYMHSTPSDSLFGRNFRAASSGCVRVEKIDQLVAWLTAGNSSVSPEEQATLKASGTSKNVTLRKPVPLFFAYVTAWATEDGVVQFRRDLYNKDGVGQIAAAY